MKKLALLVVLTVSLGLLCAVTPASAFFLGGGGLFGGGNNCCAPTYCAPVYCAPMCCAPMCMPYCGPYVGCCAPCPPPMCKYPVCKGKMHKKAKAKK